MATDTKPAAPDYVTVEWDNGREGVAIAVDRLHALLAAQGLHVVTTADKAVLDAMGDISECDLRWTLETGDIDADGNDTPAVRACRAELARRGAK